MNPETITTLFGLASTALFTFGYCYLAMVENGTIRMGRKTTSMAEIEKEVHEQLAREDLTASSKTNTSCNKPAPPHP